MPSTLLFFYTETPLHAGVGASVSVIDLPIQRERTTLYPNIPGSGVKGALRAQCMGDPEQVNLIFGDESNAAGGEGSAYAGALVVGEARLALFPIRSMKGLFAYATCPLVLARLQRDALQAGVTDLPNLITIVADHEALITATGAGDSGIATNGSVVLEEYTFQVNNDSTSRQTVTKLADWLADYALPAGGAYEYWRSKLRNGLVVLSDNVFRDFVVNSTELNVHVQLHPDSKTVREGPWVQESIPADALLVSALTMNALRAPMNATNAPGQETPEALMDWLQNPDTTPERLHLGGDETTGQGFVAIRWQNGANAQS